MVYGGMDILVDSGLRRAWCADELNAQFFRVEATPPLRIVSLCSVNGTSFARGYSLGCRTSEDRGVKKKVRPVGVCDKILGQMVSQ